MAFKYFLDLEPESPMVDPSLLTKFRKTRITEDILEEMLKETIQQVLDKGLIKLGTILVDSTHTNAAVRAKSPTQILRDLGKQLRKEIYKNAYDLSESFPEKPSLEAGLDEEIAYTKELLSVLEEGIAACGNKKIQGLAERIRGLLDTKTPTKNGSFSVPRKQRIFRGEFALSLYSASHKFILALTSHKGNSKGKKIPLCGNENHR